MASRRRVLLTRSLTTLVGSAILVALLLWAPKPVFHGMLLVCAGLGTLEMKRIAAGFQLRLNPGVVLAPLVVGFAAIYLPHLEFTWIAFLAVLLAVIHATLWQDDVRKGLTTAGMHLLACAYLGFSLLTLGFLFALGPGGDDAVGRLLVLVFFFTVWAGDSAAYLAGTFLGRRKITPVLSPNKTLEGAIANFLGNALALAVSRWFLFPEMSWVQLAVLALLFGGLGLIGDLVESGWKRGSSIKDSGQLFPGHGGVMDRVDSVFLTAPVFYVYASHFLFNG